MSGKGLYRIVETVEIFKEKCIVTSENFAINSVLKIAILAWTEQSICNIFQVSRNLFVRIDKNLIDLQTWTFTWLSDLNNLKYGSFKQIMMQAL